MPARVVSVRNLTLGLLASATLAACMPGVKPGGPQAGQTLPPLRDEAAAEPLPPPVVMPAPAPAKPAPSMRAQQSLAADMTYEGAAPPPPEAENRDRFPDAEPNPVKIVADEPVSTFSADVDTASYGFVRRALNQGVLPPPDAVRVEEMVNYFDYSYRLPQTRERPFEPTVAVYPTPWNAGTRIVHIGIQGYDLPKAERPPVNLVFLLDVSGSMDEPDKLPLLKQSLAMLAKGMTAQDRVSIVVYAGAAGVVLEPTPGDQTAKIVAALEQLSAGGSTAGGEGIKLAYDLAKSSFIQGGVNRVILATDGDFNVGITDPNALEGFVERERKSGVTLTVLGFGEGNYNDALMQTLAQAGNGNAAYIDTLNEARKVLVDEMQGTIFTIAGDVKFQVEFNPACVAEYRLIGYETRMLNREDFNNDAVDAGDIGAGHRVTALYEIATPGGARLTEPLRYGPPPQAAACTGEYAYLKIRYKLPGETASRLIERPIATGDSYDQVDRAPQDLRFAAAVAAFGQILRNEPYMRDFGYDRVIALANGAKGEDEYGYRAEFVKLVRLAQSAASMPGRSFRAGGGR